MDWSSSASRLGPRSYSYLTITHGLLEGGELGLPRLRPLQLRDPNPDEAEPVIAFGELFCELDAHIREDLRIEHVGGESPLPQVGLESLEPNLDADRAERRSLGPSSEEDVVGHIPNRRFDPWPVRDALRHGFVRRDADRAGEPLPLLDRGLHAAGVVRRVVESLDLGRDVEEGLVDAHVLEDVGVGSQDVDDALRCGGVQVVVRSEVGRLRQLVPGHADRHPAPDAELPGLVARRHDDAAPPPLLRIRADDDRLPDEVRILAALYADVESVHVHVEDDAGHGSEWTSFIIRLVSVTSVRVDFTGRRTRCPRDPA